MYLISTVYKKTRFGGKWNCQVWRARGNNILNITSTLNLKLGINNGSGMEHKNGSITVHCGSGTGFSRIEDILKQMRKNCIIKDVSVFNQ